MSTQAFPYLDLAVPVRPLSVEVMLVAHAYVCDYCEEEIDPGDDSANLKLATVEQEPRWERHFCCTSHLINWVNEDPNELEPHLALGD